MTNECVAAFAVDSCPRAEERIRIAGRIVFSCTMSEERIERTCRILKACPPVLEPEPPKKELKLPV